MKYWVLTYCDEVCGITDKEELAEAWMDRNDGNFCSYSVVEKELNDIVEGPDNTSEKWNPTLKGRI